MTREKFDELISQFASSDEHKFDNIFLVLAGELNTDHLDVVRWRYLDENDDPRYMTRKEYEDYLLNLNCDTYTWDTFGRVNCAK